MFLCESGTMVNTEAIDVVVGCMIINDFVQLCFNPFKLERMAGCGSRITATAELGSGKTSRLFAVPRSEHLLAAEASLWTK